ncbi:hypothetical protein RF11_14082 [Thelohanellus kitauei]|uniref:Uncharacterized protein n=1 Tax=Thelohanellus kitauei TaxID=669202 RepID=A0A0C2MLD4_THEKT|nr:hypothetical protein RF11_14082 [Thelohanellus kitauei]
MFVPVSLKVFPDPPDQPDSISSKSTLLSFKEALKSNKIYIFENNSELLASVRQQLGTITGSSQKPTAKSERKKGFKALLVKVSDTTAETSVRTISIRVLPVFTTITDCFRSYVKLTQLYEQQAVNRLLIFTGFKQCCSYPTNRGVIECVINEIFPWNQTNSYDEDGNVVKNHLNDFQCVFFEPRAFK